MEILITWIILNFEKKITGQMEAKKNCYYSWDEGNQAG